MISEIPGGQVSSKVPQDGSGLWMSEYNHQPNLLCAAVDVSDPSSVKAAAAQVTEQLKGAGLNLLINNAGTVKPSTLETETPENMSEVYKINAIGPMLVSQVRASRGPFLASSHFVGSP